MKQKSFENFLKRINGLTPDQIESLIGTAHEVASQKAAVGAIDRSARDGCCPHCGGSEKQKWGRTRVGAQRYRCKGCQKTFNGRTGGAVANLQKLDQFYLVLKDMFSEDRPRSVRRLAFHLGVHKDTVWRWRQIILQSLSQPDQKLGGIVEVDETLQKESRKGSREWVNHERDPAKYLKPPRLRWYEYTGFGINQKRGRSEWQLPILTAMDRSGNKVAERLPDTKAKTIKQSLTPRVHTDAALCSDGLAGYAKFAKAAGIPHFVLGSKPGERKIDQSFHIQNINALHARYKEFIGAFRGPATKYLNGYIDWFMTSTNNESGLIWRNLLDG